MPARIFQLPVSVLRVIAFVVSVVITFQEVHGRDRDLIGTPAPEWTVNDWIGAEPMTLAGLRGKVVVVRWWTAPGCPYCAGTVPVLDELWRAHRADGLVVLGMYHHKSSDPLTRAHVVAQRQRLGIEFPVAIDADWKTLRKWWLDGRERAWTSVTFVIDRRGVIRHVHPGGEIAKGSAEAAALQHVVEEALSQP